MISMFFFPRDIYAWIVVVEKSIVFKGFNRIFGSDLWFAARWKDFRWLHWRFYMVSLGGVNNARTKWRFLAGKFIYKYCIFQQATFDCRKVTWFGPSTIGAFIGFLMVLNSTTLGFLMMRVAEKRDLHMHKLGFSQWGFATILTLR